MVLDSPIRRRLTASLLGNEVAPEPHRPESVISRGVVVDARPHLLAIATESGEERFILNAESSVWRGGEIAPDALTPGDEVLVRRSPSSRWTARRVWSGLARVTGVIVDRDGTQVTVDAGHDRGQQVAVIPESVAETFRARMPRLDPGFVFDAVGVWRDNVVAALIPATHQPAIPATDPPRRTVPRPQRPRRRDAAHGAEYDGSVTWFDPTPSALDGTATADRAALALASGAAYPALDPQADCGPHCARTRGCVPLPLMSLGMSLSLRNLADPDGTPAAVPVTACASTARYFCDHCDTAPPETPIPIATTDTSATAGTDPADGGGGDAGAVVTVPRGRIAELTIASFLALGGVPEAGCFPGRLTVPGRATAW